MLARLPDNCAPYVIIYTGGMVMWFRTLAESVVGIKINHGVTLEGPVLRASPGSVEGGCPYPSFCCR